jgi:hypothetical protein
VAASYFYSSVAVPNSLAGSVDGVVTAASLASAPVGYPSSYPFKAVLDPGTGSEEIVYVTNITGTTVTMTRGREGTAGQAHDAGAVFQHMVTGKDLQDSRDHEDATVAHGATGAVVGTTNAQALTNKTIVAGSNSISGVTPAMMTLGANWPAVLTAALGANWSTALGAALGAGWPGILDTAPGAGWEAALAGVLGANWSTALAAALGANWPAALAAALGAGSVVTTTEAQTLTSKTIDGDDNTLSDLPLSALRGHQFVVHKTVDESLTSSTTIQNDDHLFIDSTTFPKFVAGTYLVELCVFWDAATAGDIKLRLTATTGTVDDSRYHVSTTQDVAESPSFRTTVIEDATELPIPGNGVGSVMGTTITGFVTFSTASNFLRFRWAQNTSSGSATRVRKGSWMRMTKVA